MGCCVGSRETKAIDHQNRENVAMQDSVEVKAQRERELNAILQQFPPTPLGSSGSVYILPPNPAYVSPQSQSAPPVYIRDYYAGMGPPLRNV